jgi:hypothetical protein
MASYGPGGTPSAGAPNKISRITDSCTVAGSENRQLKILSHVLLLEYGEKQLLRTLAIRVCAC